MNIYSQSLQFIIVFLLFITTACQTTTSHTTTSEEELDYIPGEVIIALENGVQESDIKPRIEELELEWEEYFEHLGSALIGVPVGEEKMWVQKLKEEPLIWYASLNRKVEYRGGN